MFLSNFGVKELYKENIKVRNAGLVMRYKIANEYVVITKTDRRKPPSDNHKTSSSLR